MPWHLNNHLRTRDLLAKTPSQRRELAACALTVLRDRHLLAFHAPDNHIHLLLDGPRDEALQSLRILETALSRRMGYSAGFAEPFATEIAGMSAMERCFQYVLDQRRHHGIGADPLAEASCLPDLLGMRTTGAWLIPVVRSAFPRLPRGLLSDLLGADLGAAPNPADLLEAAAAAVAAPDPEARTPELVQARAAAWRLGLELGLQRPELAQRLGISERTGRRMEQVEPPPELLRAVRLQLAARARRASVAPSAHR